MKCRATSVAKNNTFDIQKFPSGFHLYNILCLAWGVQQIESLALPSPPLTPITLIHPPVQCVCKEKMRWKELVETSFPCVLFRNREFDHTRWFGAFGPVCSCTGAAQGQEPSASVQWFQTALLLYVWLIQWTFKIFQVITRYFLQVCLLQLLQQVFFCQEPWRDVKG